MQFVKQTLALVSRRFTTIISTIGLVFDKPDLQYCGHGSMDQNRSVFGMLLLKPFQVKSVFMNRTPLPGMNKDSYWIGLSRNKDGGMEWTDGSVVVSKRNNYVIILMLQDSCRSKNVKNSRLMQTGRQVNLQRHGMGKLKIVQEFTAVANGMMIHVVISSPLFAESPVQW